MKFTESNQQTLYSSEEPSANRVFATNGSLAKNRSKTLEQTYLNLARSTSLWDASLDIFLEELCRSISIALDVGRVCVFKMDKDQKSLAQIGLYETMTSDFPMPNSLRSTDFPIYFSALHNSDIIDAHDAHSDARTREFSEVYLAPLGIGAMLDASFHKAGRLNGVVCAEHLGGIRHWTESEKRFLNSVSDLISQRLLYEKLQTQTEYQSELNAFHQAMINDSNYCILTIDHQGKIKTLNKAVTELLGYEAKELLNKDLCGKIIPIEAMQNLASDLSDEYNLDIAPGFEVLFTLVSQGRSDDCENIFRTKDGKDIPINLSVSAFRNETGQLKGYLCTASNISQRVNTRRALQEEEQRYRFLFETANEGMFLLKDGWVVDCNQTCLELYNCSKEEFLGTNLVTNKKDKSSGISRSSMLHQLKFSPEYQENGVSSYDRMQDKYRLLLEKGNSIYFDWTCKRQDGSLFDGDITLNKIDIEGISHILVSVRDVSERKKSKRALEISNESILKRNKNLALINSLSNELHAIHSVDEIYQKTLQVLIGLEYSPSVALFMIDTNDQTMNLKVQDGIDEDIANDYLKFPINPDFEGVALKTGQVCYSTDIDNDPRFTQKLKENASKLGYKTSVVIPVVHKGKPLATINVAYKDTQVLDSELLDVSSSISQTVSLALANAHYQSELEYLAHHDSLTSLSNRSHFHSQFKRSMFKGRHRHAALYLMDLNRFKEINDTLGHFTGDKILQMIGARLQDTMKSQDCVISRLGGDEFAIMVFGISSAKVAKDVALTLTHCLKAPFSLDDMMLEIDASIGIALYPSDGIDSHALLRSADVAMYQAKNQGLDYCIYDKESDDHTPERLAIVAELGSSISSGHLFLHYQPKIDIHTDQVVGFEALVRWNHPRMGMLNPGMFIPLIEMSNSIYMLTEEVLHQALSKQRHWLDAGYEYTVAVNLSARNLSDDRIVTLLKKLLKQYDTPHGMLELEITETALMQDPVRALDYLHKMSKLGIRLSIDDFGTGYSSLTYLRDLPIQKLKLDREFIMGMLTNEQGAKIVEMIIALSHGLQLTVIAEGVEDEATLQKLRSMNCHQAQGYYICKPNTWENIDDWLDKREIAAAKKLA